MKTLSDKELQDWLDGQLKVEINEFDATSKRQADLYQKVVFEIKADAEQLGPTFGFAEKVTRAAFFEAEAKKDRKQKIVIGFLVLIVLFVAAIVLAYYRVSLQQLTGNHSPMQAVLLTFFVAAVIAAVQIADKKFVQR